MTFYLASLTLLEYIWKMIYGSHRWYERLFIKKTCDDCFKGKKFIIKYKRFFFYCTVCLSVMSLSISYFWEKKLLEYDNKEESLSFISFICSVIMSCSYSKIKGVIQAIFSFFGLVTATSFDFLR